MVTVVTVLTVVTVVTVFFPIRLGDRREKTEQRGSERMGDRHQRHRFVEFDGVVRSATPKRTVVYFEADNTEDTFLPKEYNSIETR